VTKSTSLSCLADTNIEIVNQIDHFSNLDNTPWMIRTGVSAESFKVTFARNHKTYPVVDRIVLDWQFQGHHTPPIFGNSRSILDA
jgi:hypothetical protein